MLSRLKDGLLIALLFLLPWQTRLMYQAGMLQGNYWEYGTLAIYATELLLWTAVFLLVWERGRALDWKAVREKIIKNLPGMIVGGLAVVIIAGQSLRQGEVEVVWQQLIFMLGAVCLAILIITSSVRWEILVVAFWAGAIGQSLLGLYQFFGQYIAANKWLGMAYQSAGELGSSVIELDNERWLRAYGSFGSPNGLGIFLAAAFIVGLLFYEKIAPKFRPFVTLGQLLIISGLVLSFSRGAWLAALVGLAIVGIGNVRRKNIASFLKQIAYVAGVILLFVVTLWPLFSARLKGEARLEARSLQERSSQYGEAVQIFKSAPFFGVGLRNYTFVLNEPGSLLLKQPVHNVYILILTELGIIGFGLLAWFVWRLKGVVSPDMLPLVATLAVAGLFDHYLWSFYSGLILLGLGLGLAVKRRG